MHGMPAMTLTHNLAQRIVDWIAISFDTDASVADPSARIIASTDPNLIGRTHPVAQRALASGALSEGRDVQLAGSSLPIVFDDAIVGAIVLNDTSPRGRDIAYVAKTLAELMI